MKIMHRCWSWWNRTLVNIKSSNPIIFLLVTYKLLKRKHKPKDEGIFSSKKNSSAKPLLFYNKSEYQTKICNKDTYSSYKTKPYTPAIVKAKKFDGKSLYADSYSGRKKPVRTS